MKKLTAKLLPFAFCGALTGFTGCVHYTLKPEAPASMPQNRAATLPLKVGLIIDEQTPVPGLEQDQNQAFLSQSTLKNSEASFGPKFAEALRASRLFQEVRYPLPISREAFDSVDLTLSAKFGYKFTQDSLQAPKIILVCFTGFITGAVFTETSHHAAQGALTVTDRAGRELKTFNEGVDVEAKSMVSLFAELKTMKYGPVAAIDNLAAKLTQDLIDNASALAKANEAVPVPRTQPAAQAAAPEVQAKAEPEPAPAPQSAPKREPLLTYDDQLLP